MTYSVSTCLLVSALSLGILAVMLTPVPALAFTERIYVNIPDLGQCRPFDR